MCTHTDGGVRAASEVGGGGNLICRAREHLHLAIFMLFLFFFGPAGDECSVFVADVALGFPDRLDFSVMYELRM